MSIRTVGAPVIEAILLVAKLHRPTAGYHFVASSLPGHLLQLTISGRTRQSANGRHYELTPGSLIWYHEDEFIKGQVLEAPWTFYSVNFIATALNPPPFEQRITNVGEAIAQQFDKLDSLWIDTSMSAVAREMKVQSELLAILSEIHSSSTQAPQMDPAAMLWWKLETQLRRDLSREIDLGTMTRLSGKSVATIARSCERAVGLPPMKRIKQVRMSLARGLVQRSSLTFSEIAARVGYSRVHEFSRDYRRQFGNTATHDRRHPSDVV